MGDDYDDIISGLIEAKRTLREYHGDSHRTITAVLFAIDWLSANADDVQEFLEQ